jgi:hypothetical protein
VVVPPREKPELHIMNARMFNTKEARRQVESISVAMVLEELEQLLPKLKEKR